LPHIAEAKVPPSLNLMPKSQPSVALTKPRWLRLAAGNATRNVDDFTHCGIEIINPWKS